MVLAVEIIWWSSDRLIVHGLCQSVLENFRSIGRHFVYIVYIIDLLHSLECTIGMYMYFVKL